MAMCLPKEFTYFKLIKTPLVASHYVCTHSFMPIILYTRLSYMTVSRNGFLILFFHAHTTVFAICLIFINTFDGRCTYLGSQWAIRKSKYSLVTNMSVSSRISWTLGGGRAMARDTAPNSGGAHFRLCENVYCGLSLQTNNTTCGYNEYMLLYKPHIYIYTFSVNSQNNEWETIVFLKISWCNKKFNGFWSPRCNGNWSGLKVSQCNNLLQIYHLLLPISYSNLDKIHVS